VKTSRRGLFELVLAVLSAFGCICSWLAAKTVVEVAPVIDGEPVTTSLVFDPPMLTLAFLLATIAGTSAVLGFANIRRDRRHVPAYTP
jgi:hypothetical protein